MEKAPFSRLNNIQALRALAAMLVVFVHLSPIEATLRIPPFGGVGVDLFFVISGFIMVHTTRGKNVTAWVFLRNRISRIVPIYYVLTIGVFALVLFAPSLLQHTRADFVDLVKSLLFIPFIKGGGIAEPVLYVGWTLNYEMFFYAVFAMGLLFPNYRNGAVFTIAVLGALALASLGAPYHNAIADFYTSNLMVEFGLGMGVAYVFGPLAARLKAAWTKPVLIAVIVVGMSHMVVFQNTHMAENFPLFMTALPATAVVLSALVLEQNGVSVTFAPLIAVGDASYSLYLTHPFVARAVEKAYEHLPQTNFVAGVMLAAACGAVVAIALLSCRVLEKPGTKILRKLLFPNAPKPAVQTS